MAGSSTAAAYFRSQSPLDSEFATHTAKGSRSGCRVAGKSVAVHDRPLPVSADTKYSAQYMEAIFTPGMTAPEHRHSGPEAWYTLAGETCLETPEGKMVGRAGGAHVIVPGGPPMHLTATGTETRRALVLILHDSSQPPSTPARDWTPKGEASVDLCVPDVVEIVQRRVGPDDVVNLGVVEIELPFSSPGTVRIRATSAKT